MPEFRSPTFFKVGANVWYCEVNHGYWHQGVVETLDKYGWMIVRFPVEVGSSLLGGYGYNLHYQCEELWPRAVPDWEPLVLFVVGKEVGKVFWDAAQSILVFDDTSPFHSDLLVSGAKLSKSTKLRPAFRLENKLSSAPLVFRAIAL